MTDAVTDIGMSQRVKVRLCRAADRAAVVALRQAAFARAAEFRWLEPERLGWTAHDDAGVVLALRDEVSGELLSTVRISLFDDLSSAEHLLEYALSGMGLRAPLLVASRACTRPGSAQRGLLMQLRRTYVGAALALPDVAFAITLVYAGAPRLHSMSEAGFEFHVPERGWDVEALPLTQPLMAVLPRERFERAIDVMSTRLRDDGSAAAADAARVAAALRASR